MANHELRTKDWERKSVLYAAFTSLGVRRDNIVFPIGDAANIDIDTYVYCDSIVELHVRRYKYVQSTPSIIQNQRLKVGTRQISLCNSVSRCALSTYPFDPGSVSHRFIMPDRISC